MTAPKHNTGECTPQDALQEDRLLVERALAKDPAACQHLYDTYAPPLLRRLYRLTSNEQDAEDGLQHVMMEAFRSLDRYRGEGTLGAWLNRIATHKAMDILRKRQRWRAFVERTFQGKADLHLEEAALPDKLFLQQETREQVWQKVQRLSPLKRMAIILCDLEGQTPEEAAQGLGLPLGTLISRLYSGRKELKRLFENESPRPDETSGEWFSD